jgi:hypothetical protein
VNTVLDLSSLQQGSRGRGKYCLNINNPIRNKYESTLVGLEGAFQINAVERVNEDSLYHKLTNFEMFLSNVCE